ncbi:MAG: endonuclease III [Anaerolineae bacterium]|nr:endonuclease III [Anaerolineae bacterium]
MPVQEEAREKALRVHQRLLAEYGEPVWRSHNEPLDELVQTILSQNTSDVNSGRAYAQLRARYPTWEAVLDADTAALAAAIRPGGLGQMKAPRIQKALRRIQEARGELTLNFLAEMEPEAARRWLLSLDGVGPKTAAIVLLFALGWPAFPVDTHVHRVTRRLGLAPQEASPEQVQDLMEATLPPEAFYAFHLNLIAHGRQVCKALKPLCALCILRADCDWYRTIAPA